MLSLKLFPGIYGYAGGRQAADEGPEILPVFITSRDSCRYAEQGVWLYVYMPNSLRQVSDCKETPREMRLYRLACGDYFSGLLHFVSNLHPVILQITLNQLNQLKISLFKHITVVH